MDRFWIGAVCFSAGVGAICLAAFLYLRLGVLPVAVKDSGVPFEKQLVHVPLEARIAREMTSASPVQPTPETLLAGATVYEQHCSFCHGSPDAPSPLAQHMYPRAPQLWESHRAGVVGVSDDPVGETFWKVKNGIRLSGMPAYANLLSEKQMWQVSTLLKLADKPLLPEVKAELTQ